MADRYVREVGRVEDNGEVMLRVGVDYDCVSIGSISGYQWFLTRTQCEEFAQAFVAACWEAADNARLMAEEAAT